MDLTGTRAHPDLLYLDLLKRVLTRMGFVSYSIVSPVGWKRKALWPLMTALDSAGVKLVRPANRKAREEGQDWPAEAETMTGMNRLNKLQECIADVICRDVPGDLAETGVWRGGSAILMRAVLKAYGDTTRTVWAADSFRGLPKAQDTGREASKGDDLWKHPELAVSLEEVEANFERYGLLDDRVRFLEGWFSETLPNAPIERLAILRLDGDMYDSTLVALESLYPKLSPGGYVIVDDYGDFDECREAVENFRSRNGITDPIEKIDWTGVLWRRAG